ncbi:fructosamine kinase family protein [Kangiella sp.]|uniref:fructosamine kinase family protein n=1 Tax=Kangiella sp. TaxID=1920245 RepID=UPI003A8FE0FF
MFYKSNRSQFTDQLIQEAKGLELLRNAIQKYQVPYLNIPNIESVSDEQMVLQQVNSFAWSPQSMNQLGEGLAHLHKIKAPHYGLEEDNYIGLNPQVNGRFEHWGKFFIQQRLLYQTNLIKDPKVKRLLEEPILERKDLLETWLNRHCIHPSLVHGDLWSGNVLFDEQGPWLIDPAVYYGDREVDLAMSEMFGGFSESFYEGYDSIYPRTSAYPQKIAIYNLYHYLNHYNLFGGAYLQSCRNLIDQIKYYFD